MAIPLLVGTGVDYGVHLYHRIRSERDISEALAHTGKALLLSSTTTAIGFGSLLLSVHRGFYALGVVTVIGIVSCVVVSLFLMPVLISIFQEGILDPEE